MDDRRKRLDNAHLYLVCDDRPEEFVAAALRGGVDMLQLRLKDASDAGVLATAARYRALCAEHGALFIINDRPDLAAQAQADGVHLGQDDVTVDSARELLGAEMLIGLSTHSPEQVDAAASSGVDYIGVGPVHETPTKPGRPAVGLELVRYAAAHARVPFFAIGGITAQNIAAARPAGARRVAAVRALTESATPEVSARQLRRALTSQEPAVVSA